MPTHRLSIADGARAPLPGTAYSLGIETLRHRVAAAKGDAYPRSMLTASVILFEGKRQVAEQRFIDGERARLGPLQVTLVGQGDGPSSALLDVVTPG